MSPAWGALLGLVGCGPKGAPVVAAPAPVVVEPPALHVRCFQGVDGHAWHNTCTLSSQGVTVELGAVEVLPVCAVRGPKPAAVPGVWPTRIEDWSPSCYGAGDGFVCTLTMALGPAGQPPQDVVVAWGGSGADAERLTMPTFEGALSPLPTRPDAALDTRGAVEVAVWPATVGKPTITNTSCAAGQALP